MQLPDNDTGKNAPHAFIKQLAKLLTYPFILLIKIYQYIISPLIGPKCRFTPSCSHYTLEALQKYGLIKGGWLAVKRISRCRPGGGHGYDPVDPQPPKGGVEKYTKKKCGS